MLTLAQYASLSYFPFEGLLSVLIMTHDSYVSVITLRRMCVLILLWEGPEHIKVTQCYSTIIHTQDAADSGLDVWAYILSKFDPGDLVRERR